MIITPIQTNSRNKTCKLIAENAFTASFTVKSNRNNKTVETLGNKINSTKYPFDTRKALQMVERKRNEEAFYKNMFSIFNIESTNKDGTFAEKSQEFIDCFN